MGVYTDSKVQAIASAIREQNGTSTQYNIGEMPQAIKDLHTLKTAEGYPLRYNAVAFPTEIEIGGNTYQETTTGKNLLNIFQNYSAGYTTTINGITYTLNKDGSISAKGTATDLSIFNVFNTQSALTNLVGKTITLSGTPTGLPNGSFLAIYNSSYSDTGKIVDSGTGGTGTITNDLWRFIVRIPNGATIDTKFYPMIRLSSVTDNTYEPYVGGTAAPSPDYPMDVRTVRGYNKFYGQGYPSSIFGGNPSATVKFENGNITTNSNFYQWSSKFFEIDGLKKNTTYQLSFNINKYSEATAAGVFAVVVMRGYATSSVLINNITIDALGKRTITFNTDQYDKIGISFNGAGTSTSSSYIQPIVFENVQIVESKVDKKYVPYGEIGIKRTGKNIFDKNSFKIQTKAAYNSSGDAVYWASYIGFREYIDAKENTTYSASISTGKGVSVAVFYDDKLEKISTVTNKSIFTTPANTKYMRICWYDANEELPTWCQIEESSTPSTYEPYQERIDYINLQGNEVLSGDHIEQRDNHLWLIKNWGKVVLDGSESWTTINNSTPNYIYLVSNKYDSLIGSNTFIQYSTHFSQPSGKITPSYITDKPVISGTNVNGEAFKIRILIPSSVANDAATFKTWLSQNKPVVYYQLATPQEIDLGLSPICTIDGTNNVEILSELEPSSMKETYISK